MSEVKSAALAQKML